MVSQPCISTFCSAAALPSGQPLARNSGLQGSLSPAFNLSKDTFSFSNTLELEVFHWVTLETNSWPLGDPVTGSLPRMTLEPVVFHWLTLEPAVFHWMNLEVVACHWEIWNQTSSIGMLLYALLQGSVSSGRSSSLGKSHGKSLNHEVLWVVSMSSPCMALQSLG